MATSRSHPSLVPSLDPLDATASYESNKDGIVTLQPNTPSGPPLASCKTSAARGKVKSGSGGVGISHKRFESGTCCDDAVQSV